MAETAILTAIETFLTGPMGLSPAPSSVGSAEPLASADLPAVVLSLDEVKRSFSDLRGESQLRTGALPWRAVLDLAEAVLNEDRTQLLMPQRGLVRADGSSATLTGGDLEVSVNDTPLVVVPGPPAGWDAWSTRSTSATASTTRAPPATWRSPSSSTRAARTC